MIRCQEGRPRSCRCEHSAVLHQAAGERRLRPEGAGHAECTQCRADPRSSRGTDPGLGPARPGLGRLGLRVMSLAASLAAAFEARPDPDAVPAASVAVAADGQEVIAAWGARTSTLFQAASISKPVAALVALRLVADGRLDLDADVNGFLTSWQLPGGAGDEPVTLRHLLCHGGGLTVPGFPGYRQDEPLPSLTEMLDGLPPSNTPPVRRDGPAGRQWSYSGGGYLVVQQLAQDSTGRPFADLAEELVLQPAAMGTASYAQPDPADAAAPHVCGRQQPWRVHPEHAAAGLWCTPADLLHLPQAIQ